MSNYPPDFDFDADSGVHEDCLTHENGSDCFKAGLQAMREMIARFVEHEGDAATPGKTLAISIRANWWPCWGEDPGKPEKIAENWDSCL